MGLVLAYLYYVTLAAVVSAILALLNLSVVPETIYVAILAEIFDRTKLTEKRQRSLKESLLENSSTGKLPCFRVAPLNCWNLLARYNSEETPVMTRWHMGVYLVGFIIRYAIIFPVRLVLLAFGFATLAIGSCLLLFVPMAPETRQWGGKLVSYATMRILSRTGSVYSVFHNTENRPTHGGIAVANHCSPVDCVILGIDNYYAMTGQTHGGMLGCVQKLFNNIFPHIWFERSAKHDRDRVRQWLQQHMTDPTKPPILAFPEGMCVNNTALINFKRGAFEAADIIYPIVLKFDQRFGDPFWSQDTYIPHLFAIMTSWCLKVDVYYLAPEKRLANESPDDFAVRIKRLMAAAGGFDDLNIDAHRQKQQPSQVN